jgi:hypothetical protein
MYLHVIFLIIKEVYLSRKVIFLCLTPHPSEVHVTAMMNMMVMMTTEVRSSSMRRIDLC